MNLLFNFLVVKRNLNDKLRKIIDGVYWQFPVSLAKEEPYRNNVIDPFRFKL